MKQRMLKVLIILAVLTRLYALYATRGMMHYDNLYQVLEPAHTLAFGYGIRPWEFTQGIRSWLQPLMTAGVFRLGVLAGFSDINSLVFLNRCVMAAFSIALLYVTYATAVRLYDQTAGAYALLFAAFSGMLWVWSADVSSSVPSTLFSTAAFMFFYAGWREGLWRQYLFSGVCLGIAFMFRFDSLLFVLPLALFVAWGRVYDKAGFFVAGLAAVVLLHGVLDYVTWGSFMHSPAAFVMQNLFEGKSVLFGRQPFYFYMTVLALHLTGAFLLPYAFEKRSGFVFLSLNAVTFFAAYSLLPHKELRFMMPILPLFCILAARGMENAVRLYGKPMLYCMAALTVAQGVLVPFAIGWESDWDKLEAMSYVGVQPDSTGVAYTARWFESGAYTYLHKKIPAVHIANKTVDPSLEYVECGRPDMEAIGFQCSPLEEVVAEEGINYVISNNHEADLKMEANGFRKVKDYGQIRVYRR